MQHGGVGAELAAQEKRFQRAAVCAVEAEMFPRRRRLLTCLAQGGLGVREGLELAAQGAVTSLAWTEQGPAGRAEGDLHTLLVVDIGWQFPRFSGEKGIWHRIQRRSSSEVAWSRSRNGWRKRKLRSFMIETCGLFGGFEPESFNLGNDL